tara:strand:+ start:940 stop:1182 length:243 start_codon:yes stop_codon:yes gene_type:complete
MIFIKKIFIRIIKIYQFLISPLLGSNCRYLPTCSEYFIACLNEHGLLKGIALGTKRILRCHPIKFLGGGSGFDPLKNRKD